MLANGIKPAGFSLFYSLRGLRLISRYTFRIDSVLYSNVATCYGAHRDFCHVTLNGGLGCEILHQVPRHGCKPAYL